MKNNPHANGIIKWMLWNYECDNCDVGLVQIHSVQNRKGFITDTVSGCMNCKKDFGINQASQLKPFKP